MHRAMLHLVLSSLAFTTGFAAFDALRNADRPAEVPRRCRPAPERFIPTHLVASEAAYLLDFEQRGAVWRASGEWLEGSYDRVFCKTGATYEASDGSLLTVMAAYYETPEAADRAFLRSARGGERIAMWDVNRDAGGRVVGRRAVVLFAPNGEEYPARMLWTEGSVLHAVFGPTSGHVQALGVIWPGSGPYREAVP